jgi:transcriptional regulator with PAS, ATPase and Fis domain
MCSRTEEKEEMKSRLEALVTEMVERGILFEDAVEEFEKHFILSVLKQTNGNLSKAAEELRIHRNTLSKRVEKYFQNGHMMGARRRGARKNEAPHTPRAKSRK